MRPLFITLFKVIASALFLVLLIGCRTHAAMYPFTASFDGTSIVATMTGVPDDTTQYQLYNNSTPLTSSNLATTTDTSIQTQIGGTVTWTIAGRALVNGTYNLHVEKVVPADQTPPTFPGTTFPGSPAPAGVALTDTVSVTVAGSTADFFEWPLLTASPTGQTIVVAGKIDTSLYSSPLSALQIKLEYSTAGTITGDKHAIAHSSLGTSSVEGVADDGSYYFELSALTPKTKYYYRQTITDATNAVLSTKDLYFDSTAGYVPAGSLAEQDLEAPYTYHLLAPWPGLHALYDPALCQQKKVEGKIAQNAVCDVNGFINFAFKTLIGLTAVILVLRLVLIGYEYMTTGHTLQKGIE